MRVLVKRGFDRQDLERPTCKRGLNSETVAMQTEDVTGVCARGQGSNHAWELALTLTPFHQVLFG